MTDGWKLKKEMEELEADRALYLFRALVAISYNANSKKKIKAESIMRLSMDKINSGEAKRALLKQRSDDLFEKARHRGNL